MQTVVGLLVIGYGGYLIGTAAKAGTRQEHLVEGPQRSVV